MIMDIIGKTFTFDYMGREALFTVQSVSETDPDRVVCLSDNGDAVDFDLHHARVLIAAKVINQLSLV